MNAGNQGRVRLSSNLGDYRYHTRGVVTVAKGHRDTRNASWETAWPPEAEPLYRPQYTSSYHNVL